MNQLITNSARHKSSRIFTQLMDIYAENYRQLRLLFDDTGLQHDRLVSLVPDQLNLYFEVLERHRYTTIARMTYVIDDGAGGQSLDPDAHIRIYHDALMAEATYCYPGDINQPIFGTWKPLADIMERRLRINRFLDRWLEYLLHLGHGLGTMSPLPDDFHIRESRLERRDLELISAES